MAPKTKLSIEQQIEHMKSKGITFDLFSEEQAKEYLCKNNYYFKLKSYCKVFEKYQYGDKKGQYINLDFAYLVELAILDMHLRHFIIQATVDLEHIIKVSLLNDFNDTDSDGYDIIEDLFNTFPEIHDQILRKQKSYNSDLIAKLEVDGYAIWNVIEVLSFGDFIKLYGFFYGSFPGVLKGVSYEYPMKAIKSLRNAAAHNTCLLSQLNKQQNEDTKTNKKVSSFVTNNVPSVGKTQRKTCMSYQLINDFVTLLYMINNLTSGGMRDNILKNLNELVNVRMVKHSDYFQKNNVLISVYDFIKKIIDTMCVL